MPARLLVIGFDAVESTLLEKWIGEGRLPTLARLTRDGAKGRLGNPMETLPGAIWPEIQTGRSSGKVGVFYHPLQVHSGEPGLRPVEHDEIDVSMDYWNIASEAGRRVCVVDAVQSALNPKLNGIQILEYALHDRTFDERTHPAGLLDEIHGKYGQHPVRRCDGYAHSDAGRRRLLGDLRAGHENKRALLLDLMEREHWDLFTCSLGEGHCVGHHLWHYLDAHSPWYQSDAPEDLQGGIRTIYETLDRTAGELIEAAGPDCKVIVVVSHGMGPSRAGYQLMPEVLARLGMSSDQGRAGVSRMRALQRRVRDSVPDGWRPALRALSEIGVIKKLQQPVGALRFPLESPATKAVFVPNNRVGAIRLNLRGREPNGCVAPGAEADALMAELRHEFLQLVDPDTKQPIIERVITADEQFDSHHHPDVPDMMIVFTPGTRPIEACES
jgi:predicted AlkP superfamily phosphohydrolase/phosphomutase